MIFLAGEVRVSPVHDHEAGSTMKSKKPAAWSNVRASPGSMDRAGLVGLIRDLYQSSTANRRFVHARFVRAASTPGEYRDLVARAVFQDPLSQRPIRLREAAAAITDYKRSTGDLVGVVDLLLTFVEAGTAQAADVGYGDEGYFSTLERRLTEAATLLDGLPDAVRVEATGRIVRLAKYRGQIGWGYGDYLADIATRAQRGHSKKARENPQGRRAQSRGIESRGRPRTWGR